MGHRVREPIGFSTLLSKAQPREPWFPKGTFSAQGGVA